MEQFGDKRDLYSGFGDTLARAFEMVATPAVFAIAGYALDRWLGLLPLLTIVFTVLALVGTGARTYYSYQAKMQSLDDASPWGRP